MNLIVIDNLKDFKALGESLTDVDLLAFDTETTGLTRRDEVIGISICYNEDTAYYVILAYWDAASKSLKYNDNKLYVHEFLLKLQTKQLIAHNGVFDCMMLESNFKVRLIDSLHTDTMILAHLLNENRRVGLKELSVTMFGENADAEAKEMKDSVVNNGGSVTKKAYEIYKADPYILGKYGAKDALLTFKLFMALIPDLYEQELDKFFYEDESMPLLRGPTYDMNSTGLMLDLSKLSSLKASLKAECAAAKDFIYTEINKHIKEKYPGTNKSNTFNIGSNQQLSWLLFGQMELEFNILTKEGKAVCKALGLKLPYSIGAKRSFLATCRQAIGQVYSPEGKINGKVKRAKKVKEPWCYVAVDKKTLKKYAAKFKWVEALLEYNRKQKLLNTYVNSMENKVQYGVIQPSFLQHGTSSGRYSSREPNFQNLPRDDQRIKECVITRPGKVFVSADYSQLEPRVFAYYSQDSKLMSAFDGQTDFYSVIGIDLYDKFDALPLKEGHPDAFGVKYKKLRDSTKTIALARAYGATPYQLAPTLGRTVEETTEDIAKYDERFPGVKKMMLDAHHLAKTEGRVTNLFGRPRRMPDAKRIPSIYGNVPHSDLPYEARSLLNLACNHRIQSTGASLINRAAIAFYRLKAEAGIDCKIVCQVHDELIVECSSSDADAVSTILRHCMETTNELPGVPLEAIPRITSTLAK